MFKLLQLLKYGDLVITPDSICFLNKRLYSLNVAQADFEEMIDKFYLKSSINDIDLGLKPFHPYTFGELKTKLCDQNIDIPLDKIREYMIQSKKYLLLKNNKFIYLGDEEKL